MSWFEPQHYIVDRVAPFFARRFAGMRWAILTPYRSARWDGEALSFGPGGTRADAPPRRRAGRRCGAPITPTSSIPPGSTRG